MIIGMIQYINSLPLTYGLERYGTVILDTPAQLAERFHQGECDAAMIPVVEYLKHRDEYVLVPGVSISSYGPTGSVYLVYEGDVSELSRICLYPDSRTTNKVVQALLAKKNGTTPRMMLPHEACEGKIIIGDAALEMTLLPGESRVDVGSLWFDVMKTPMVFAVGVARTQEIASCVGDYLAKIKEYSLLHVDEILIAAGRPQYAAYIRGLNYDFTRDHEKSILMLEDLLAEGAPV